MASTADLHVSNGNPLPSNPIGFDSGKSLPILSSGRNDHLHTENVMDLNNGPPTTFGVVEGEEEVSEMTPTNEPEQLPMLNGLGDQPVASAAAAQQPKVVQTAFIHKLYNMLEDQSIRHLISWSDTNESFVMSPSSEFIKVLGQYFKHTNISSFVRQLNMYGFHKVSDVFHNGSPDSALWEFKHGGGNFKRGDLLGLRDIKRRASRHALIHRDSFTAPKMPVPPMPGATMEMPMQDPVEARLNWLELYTTDMNMRMMRTEEAYAALTSKCQGLLDGLSRCQQWTQELSSQVLALAPDPDHPTHQRVSAMRQDMSRQFDQLRSLGEPQDAFFGSRQSLFQTNGMNLELPLPLSPRQRPFDESRRSSLQTARMPSVRPSVAPQAPMSPRRYGSIANGSGTFSPAYNRSNYLPPPPPPPPLQQANASVASPPGSLARRHTSADIRVQGWNGTQPPSQFPQGSSPCASGESSSAWPSSPRQAAQAGDMQLRDALAQYDMRRASNAGSRQHSPPPPHETGLPAFNNSFGGSYANSYDAGWQLPGARYPFKGLEASRRSSMASNVHSLLNPADTAEREGEDEPGDERKRKRVL